MKLLMDGVRTPGLWVEVAQMVAKEIEKLGIPLAFNEDSDTLVSRLCPIGRIRAYICFIPDSKEEEPLAKTLSDSLVGRLGDIVTNRQYYDECVVGIAQRCFK